MKAFKIGTETGLTEVFNAYRVASIHVDKRDSSEYPGAIIGELRSARP